MKNNNIGIISGILACIIWGLLPLFWKLLDSVSPNMILIHRNIWAFIILSLLLFFNKKILISLSLLKNKQNLLLLASSSFSLVFGWYLFIWGISHNFITEIGLGYYINPLITVFLGIIFLKEKISKSQYIGIFLTLLGFIFKVFDTEDGRFIGIVIALLTASLQATYGFLKKITKNIPPIESLFLEVFLSIPIVILYLAYHLKVNNQDFFMEFGPYGIFLLIMTGFVTIIPLILFVFSTSKIPLSLLGFIQYLPPTLIVFIGILNGEKIGVYGLLSLIMIILGIFIFSISSRRK